MRTGVLFCTVLGIAATAGVVACGTEEFFGCGFDNDASPGVQGAVTKVAGDGVSGQAGEDVVLAVELTDIDGESLCESNVTWTAAANSGVVTPGRGGRAADRVHHVHHPGRHYSQSE